jgi:hypothetical protein
MMEAGVLIFSTPSTLIREYVEPLKFFSQEKELRMNPFAK